MCWNYMTRNQQGLLRNRNRIEEYGGGPCQERATVAVDIGYRPGPRYYCAACARNSGGLILTGEASDGDTGLV